MLNILLMINFLVGYESVELPAIKVSESKNVIVKEVVVQRRFFGSRKNYVEVDVVELPAVKESDLVSANTEIIEVEYAKRQPVRRIVSGVKNLISESRILPRNGTFVKGNDGNPIILEETTTNTVKKFDVKDSKKIQLPVEENENEQRVMVYEDRRIFSGRVRNRIFIRSR